MAAAGRRWQRCSSCGCRLMSASGQRPCCPSHGRGHHLPGRSTSIAALWRTAWLQESACWAVAVERWARRGATRRRKGLFHPCSPFCPLLDPPRFRTSLLSRRSCLGRFAQEALLSPGPHTHPSTCLHRGVPQLPPHLRLCEQSLRITGDSQPPERHGLTPCSCCSSRSSGSEVRTRI